LINRYPTASLSPRLKGTIETTRTLFNAINLQKKFSITDGLWKPTSMLLEILHPSSLLIRVFKPSIFYQL